MRIPIAPVAYRLLVPLAVAGILIYIFIWHVAGLLFVLLSGFIVFFFRDPERKTPQINGAILSPADGKVVAIEEVDYPGMTGQKAVKATIFLSLFDVHITRSPIDGKVMTVKYQPGRFFNAMKAIASEKNENNVVGFKNGEQYIFIKQIAGIVARRIICHCHVGQTLEAGERVGLICFGSRVEAYLPLDTELKVRKGMRVIGGKSVLGIRADAH